MKDILLGISLFLNVIIGFFLAWGVLFPFHFASVVLGMGIGGAYYDQMRTQFEVLETEPDGVVMLGDSITDGGRWHLLFPDENIINFGIGGDTTKGVLNRIDQVTRAEPRLVFIMIGTNDLSMQTPPEEVAANVHQMVKIITDASPVTKVAIQSILPREEKFAATVKETNTLLVDVADEAGATYVDLYPLFADDKGVILNQYSNDSLHLLGEGYQVWAATNAPMMGSAPATRR